MLSNPRKLRLFIFEKDPHDLFLIRRVLDRNLNFPFAVDESSELSDALRKISRNTYSMFLIQDELSEKNQLEVLRGIQAVCPDVPILLMADRRDDRLAREALFNGASELIIKNEMVFHDLGLRLEAAYHNFSRAHPDLVKNRLAPRGGANPEKDAFTAAARLSDSSCDELTGIYNHTHLHDCLAREFEAAKRHGHSLSCLFLDLDHFKAINRELGFDKGDQVLRECAQLLLDNCRMTDVVARFGADKFVILLPHAGYNGAMDFASRMSETLMKTTFFPESSQASATLSMGVSSFPEDDISQHFDLIALAEKAALRSKLGGRNRITRYKDFLNVFADDYPALKISEGRILAFQRRMSDISDTARRAYLDASRTLIQALEVKDKHTAEHSAAVASHAKEIAEAMGLASEDAEAVQHAGLLHDIGKLSMPDDLLQKQGKLTFPEYEEVKQHAYFGYKLLKPIKFLQQECVMVLHHHEWFNGEGYPSRLKGVQIPLGSRIIAVADTFDTLRSSGARYRSPVSACAAAQELVRCSGSQFDPVVVKAFLDILVKRGEIKEGDFCRETLEEKVRESLSGSANPS